MLNKIKKGELDILSGVVGSKEREQYLSFTKPYISFTNIIATNKNARPLIVDDNQIILTITSKILLNAGLQSNSVSSGEGAVKHLLNNKCDLILMDIQMPGVDGYQTTKLIREELKLDDLPIIGLSANAMESDIKLGIESGMNDYLSKPSNPALLFKAIESQLMNTNSILSTNTKNE